MNRRQKVLRWVGRSATALLVLGIVSAGVITISTERRLNRVYDTRIESLVVRNDAVTRARGEHLVRSLANCVDCHGDDLGGKTMLESAAIGTIAGPNITPGGRPLDTDDWTRAITRAVDGDGHPLLVMPSADYNGLGKEDIGAIIAYARSVPAVRRDVPDTRLGPVGRVMLATGQLPVLDAERIDHSRPLQEAPQPAVTAVFGEYLAHNGGCHGCHTASLAGGPVPGAPPSTPHSADIRASALQRYTDAEIEGILRTGRRPDGHMVDPMMPWKATAQMTDDELQALILYLRKGPDTRRAALP